MQIDERIKQIRAKVDEERRLISHLANTLSNDDVKHFFLGQATRALDFVEDEFLDPKILSEQRNPHAMIQWLDSAETFLGTAVQARQNADALLKKYGPDVRLIS